MMNEDEDLQDRDDDEPSPVNAFLACPHALKDPKFHEILTNYGWNSLLCLSIGDVNVLSRLKHAQKIYFVVSACILSPPFVDMVLKTIKITEDAGSERLLLRLDDTEIPPILSMIRQFPEDTRLYSYILAKRSDIE